jgi:hypothetical protein
MFGFGNFVPGAYTPVLAKHSKHLMPADAIDIGSAAGFRTECLRYVLLPMSPERTKKKWLLR